MPAYDLPSHIGATLKEHSIAMYKFGDGREIPQFELQIVTGQEIPQEGALVSSIRPRTDEDSNGFGN